MPRFSLDPQASPRERKVAQYRQMQSGDQQQQVIDQQGQGSMIDMLKTLYGLHTQSQMEPLQMQALQQDVQAKGLENEGRANQNAWAEPNAQLRYANEQAQNERAAKTQEQATALHPLQMEALKASVAEHLFQNQHAPELLQSKLGADAAQQAYYTARDTGAVTPRDELQYKMHTGQDWVSPEQQAGLAKQKAAEQAAAREADQKQQTVQPGTDTFGVPHEYLNDPKIAMLLAQANKNAGADHEYYRKGGGLDTELVTKNLRRKTNPIQSWLSDLMALYQ